MDLRMWHYFIDVKKQVDKPDSLLYKAPKEKNL
jgi:hypothetical protein